MQKPNTAGISAPPSALATVGDIWRDAAMPEHALSHLQLSGENPVLPSSFALGTAAQSSIALAALAAAEIGHQRSGQRQSVQVDMLSAAQECRAWFAIDGQRAPLWDPVSGLYRCGEADSDQWVRIHANFKHHRVGALNLLGLSDDGQINKQRIERQLSDWSANDFEARAAERGLAVSALRRFAQWDAHPQSLALREQPMITFERISDAPARQLPDISPSTRPLDGLRVIDATRILAGPVCGRTLAAYGADVMMINSPKLPNIDAIADTSRGKRSAHIDLNLEEGRHELTQLCRGAHVFVQGYRPGALASRGFGPQEVANECPGIIYLSLSAYGDKGPWANRRGFDSLVQTATGFNRAEAQAANQSTPMPLPVQILDYCSGFLMAFAVQAALHRQQSQGGSWHVKISLARTGHWLRTLGRSQSWLEIESPAIEPYLAQSSSGFGRLTALKHAAQFSRTPALWSRRSMPPGSHIARWTE